MADLKERIAQAVWRAVLNEEDISDNIVGQCETAKPEECGLYGDILEVVSGVLEQEAK